MAQDPPGDPLPECDGTELVRVRKGHRWRWMHLGLLWDVRPWREEVDSLARQVAALAQIPGSVLQRVTALEQRSDLTARVAALEKRSEALEKKPEEVVPYTASVSLGALSIGTRTVSITGLSGIVAGDRVLVAAQNALPAGLQLAGGRATAAGTVEVSLVASIVLTVPQPIPLLITVLR